MTSTHTLFDDKTKILVPVELPDPQPFAPWLVDFLGALDVHVLGCYLVKEQTSLEQSRDQFEEEARERLDEVVARFQDTGAQTSSTLVFTHDIVETIDRAEAEIDVDLLIRPSEVGKISNLLAVVTDDLHLERVRQCITALLEESVVPVTLLHVMDEDAESSEREKESLVLDGLKQRLIEHGLDEDRIETRCLHDADPAERTIEFSRDYDVVIMDENEKKLRDQLLRQTPIPIIMVRAHGDED
ncbi:universal stress protein [Persicimonas caeni]|uniref:Universal stress protein n=1 Tax=Persicimonas caeni TaxID=2292766 RepID=A0A4Y6PPK8_PERCE|nr:universal stress protein [Persicimonas caeni]QDG50291.1 universal stress protein [Persicimonas caeni]QED31512.1 universal stress protein [Persicimonas caeni]